MLDAPGLRPPLPTRLPPGRGSRSLLREAVKTRLEGSRPVSDPDAVKRAQNALRLGRKDAAFAVMYLREVGVEPAFRFSAAKALASCCRRRAGGGRPAPARSTRGWRARCWELRLPHDAEEALGEVRRRLAATQLFEALLEAGFTPENNWDEAVESHESALELVPLAVGRRPTGARRGVLRLRRAAGGGATAAAGVPRGVRDAPGAAVAAAGGHGAARGCPGPEFRECHDREMLTLQAFPAAEMPEAGAGARADGARRAGGHRARGQRGGFVRPPALLGVREGEAAGPVAGGVRRRPAAGSEFSVTSGRRGSAARVVRGSAARVLHDGSWRTREGPVVSLVDRTDLASFRSVAGCNGNPAGNTGSSVGSRELPCRTTLGTPRG